MSQILWAEDSETDQQLILAALRQMPYRHNADFVLDGVDLMARLETDSPGLIVLDLGMPRMGGIETLQQLRAGKRRVPVVVFTGHDDSAEAKECLRLGARDVVQKPTDFNEFRSAVQRIVQYTV
ncbi:MAG: two-component system, OmpR family, response regulator QseB [Thermoplasmata archaeon]|nr:two-component system, OmpR family, response regulator QseB [Thermoplasmata archaeon]MEA3166536.1 two-component system, OmpR family, response regulator QseB [Thermoplasmata archaeon]